MGGGGSGRRTFRQTTDWHFKVDLAEICRQRRDQGGMRWRHSGNRYFNLRWKLTNESLVLHHSGGVEFISLCWSGTCFGGKRQWLACPDCNRRCRIVYLGRRGYRCRLCLDLAYPSQREEGHHRALGKAQRWRMRLGGDPNMTLPFPAKPKGMRWRTYWTLQHRDQALTAQWTAGISQALGIQGAISTPIRTGACVGVTGS